MRQHAGRPSRFFPTQLFDSMYNCTILLTTLSSHGIRTRWRDELLANLLYPNKKPDEARQMARCVGIAYANCGCHPIVYKICQNIFGHPKDQKFSPHLAGLSDLIKVIDTWQFNFYRNGEIQFFPYFKTICRFTQIPIRAKVQKRSCGHRRTVLTCFDYLVRQKWIFIWLVANKHTIYHT